MARKIPLRQCVGCGEMKPKRDMIRILRTPDDEFMLDSSGRKNGRGAYLCRQEECLKKARKNKGLEKSFKVHIPDEIYDRLEAELKAMEKEPEKVDAE